MRHLKIQLLSTTVVPAFVVAGIAIGGSFAATSSSGASESNSGLLPAAKPRNPIIELASCSPCNPCGAKKACSACNPCAAKKPCNPCNPCSAKNPCNPCNPCAAKKACGPCNPCAAKNPCNPCAAKACNPCNPCGAKKPCNPCNPCNPCGAAKEASYSAKCEVPRLVAAWGSHPCNPCNPCAAKNPCNPCAAKNLCNPCNPCGAGAEPPELSQAESKVVYDCLKPELTKAYAKAGVKQISGYTGWLNVATAPYLADTHGGRYVNNYVDVHGDYRYKKYENAGVLPEGTTLAKDSFVAHHNGKVSIGPMFVMEKMSKGWNEKTGDWRYSMVLPNGSIAGSTGGKGVSMQFCADCHSSVAPAQDHIMLLPEDYRVKF